MPCYRFIVSGLDGRIIDAEAADLPHDLAALRYGSALLSLHPTAARLSICDGDRHVAHMCGPGGISDILAVSRAVQASRARIERSLELLHGQAGADAPRAAQVLRSQI